MTLNLTIPQPAYADFTPRITVFGVGGGGTNAVDNMILLQLKGVEFVVANTDAQQLMKSCSDNRIQLGPHLTQGLGAGAKPDIGRAAAEEAAEEIARHMENVHMVFITAGMGGGTGTGAAPVIARMARERGILTVGVVTKPFTFEGARRARLAETGIAELQQFVDTLIVIPNQNLFRTATENTTWQDAFKMADEVLYMGVKGVTDLMMSPGLVNLDFADIRTVMAEMGKAMMGTGEVEGENRAIRAAESAISNPLLEDTSMSGARGLLINITGGSDLTLFEVDQAANRIREEVAEDANIIFGSAIDESLTGKIRVSVVATGIESPVQYEKQSPVAPPTEPEKKVVIPEAASLNTNRTTNTNVGQVAETVETQKVPEPIKYQEPPAMAKPATQPKIETPIETNSATHNSDEPRAPSPDAIPERAAKTSPRSGLFSDSHHRQDDTPPPPSRSLFGIVTGALRGNKNYPNPSNEQGKSEPSITSNTEEQGQSNGETQAKLDEEGLDIPAFLRRKS
ncbi:Cell division GTPase FtsZ (FtsZ) (PDB:1FSZ) [Commensalibacter communis]|uniref:Cell division protein FtsZ n=1 Tax=Commensalibacter communis TaxID=2972786 RepID=A0A9W4TLS3_9PROT|nr:cell division protein FtsZ [Commensalibacter communis]CAI3922226.1 Cell division GTPase FtsZ (FtsZ) (PDB:1FSZ) [Commensalibacter communis]CAI3923202.1 Cell division GTPase FtsZ (FtsZ) (PDB:1FSZ) [Commensalibacter communis]CAI3923260.1 Cell division GTPase FtsZ (FtsZ) (PDB:1FSZ) [Commensalibacter communis]CAI3931472.1 Cell division GTPase FtsZ (FtsZ) (PDB:1FSZ) [Commensalibacter communis]CAI3931523.1 Cell division GTPase FtsZ (FtsZ) (PDB:1FSZ) [Commensalibacter communis]